MNEIFYNKVNWGEAWNIIQDAPMSMVINYLSAHYRVLPQNLALLYGNFIRDLLWGCIKLDALRDDTGKDVCHAERYFEHFFGKPLPMREVNNKVQ